MILIMQITFLMMGIRNASDASCNSQAMALRFRARRSAERHIGRVFSLVDSHLRIPTSALGLTIMWRHRRIEQLESGLAESGLAESLVGGVSSIGSFSA